MAPPPQERGRCTKDSAAEGRVIGKRHRGTVEIGSDQKPIASGGEQKIKPEPKASRLGTSYSVASEGVMLSKWGKKREASPKEGRRDLVSRKRA